MVSTDTINMDNLERFWYWIEEREQIRNLKDGGEPAPWTKDPLLQKFHFCNVRREDDRGTKEIRQVVRKADFLAHTDLPWVYTLARLFNHPGTLNAFLMAYEKGTWNDARELIKFSRSAGNKIFHVAYVVSTCGQSVDKVDYVLDVAEQVKRLLLPPVGLDSAHTILMSVDGLGSFLAAQVVADLRNDRYLKPVSSFEKKYWSAMGPGSKKGLDFLFHTKTTAGNYQSRMEQLFRIMPEEIATMDIHAQDLQNCLCEFSKYMRHLNSLGGRARYYDR